MEHTPVNGTDVITESDECMIWYYKDTVFPFFCCLNIYKGRESWRSMLFDIQQAVIW